MKKMILSVLLSILLTFSVLGLSGSIILRRMIHDERYMIQQIEKTDTYTNVHDSLMKKFSDAYNTTFIPAEVYEKAFPPDWTKNAVNRKIISAFSNDSDQETLDYSQAEKSITEYFENYAHENHVIRDENYKQILHDSISDAIHTADTVTDVFRTEIMKKTRIWSKVELLRKNVDKVLIGCLLLSLLFTVLLFLLKKPVYWIGTSFFSSGFIMTAFSAYIKISKLIMNFSVKEYTTYTLVTAVLNSAVNMVLFTGVLLFIFGMTVTAYCSLKREKALTDKA